MPKINQTLWCYLDGNDEIMHGPPDIGLNIDEDAELVQEEYEMLERFLRRKLDGRLVKVKIVEENL